MSESNAPAPLVSVIIPVYNAEKYLRETLDCVCNQTLRNIEIICVDDGSTDGSLSILEEYAARDGRFCILQQKNQYAGVARNNGMAAAKGKYLSFLDADDLFELDMLEKMSARAEETEAEIVLCKADCFTDVSLTKPDSSWIINDRIAAKLPAGIFVPRRDIPESIFQLSTGVPWNKLFLREFVEIKKLRWAATQNANDFGFVYQAMAASDAAVLIDCLFIHYRLRIDSIAHAKGKKPEVLYNALVDLMHRLQGISCFELVKRSFYEFLLNQLVWHIGAADESARRLRAELYMEKYEPIFQLLQVPVENFVDVSAYKRVMSVLSPAISIVVQESDPDKIARCLASFRGFNLGANEILCSKSTVLAAKEEGIPDIIEALPGIRMLHCPVSELRGFAKSKRVAIVPEGMMLGADAGGRYASLPGGPDGLVDISGILVKTKGNDWFYRCSPGKKSFRFLGKGILSVCYMENAKSYWLLGIKVWESRRAKKTPTAEG